MNKLYRFVSILLMVGCATPIMAQHFQIVGITDSNASLIVTSATINEHPLGVNDEIGAFDPNGVCAGAAVIEEPDRPVGVVLWGDERRTDVDEGFVNGDEIRFRFWDAAREIECSASMEVIQGERFWVANGLTIARLSSPGAGMVEVTEFEHNFGMFETPFEEMWQIRVTNIGNGNLAVDSIVVTGDRQNFRIDYEFDVIPPDSSAIFNCMFFETDLPPIPGERNAEFSIFTNNPQLVIRVMLTGEIGAARLWLLSWIIDFGDVAIEPNDANIPTVSRRLLVPINRGNIVLRLSDLRVSAPFYLPEGTPVDYSVEPGDSAVIPIEFDPDTTKEYVAYYLRCFTNAINTDWELFIGLTGRGIDPQSVEQDNPVNTPLEFMIHAPYPNPFNAMTNIRYDVISPGIYRLMVVDINGSEVAKLRNGFLSYGSYADVFHADRLVNGVYLVVFEGAGLKGARMLQVIK